MFNRCAKKYIMANEIAVFGGLNLVIFSECVIGFGRFVRILKDR